MSALTVELELSTAQAADIAGEVILQDNDFLVAFDPATGALTRMEHKPTKWIVERRPALGASFRMLVPIPGRRANFVFGQKQKAASVEKISDSQVRIVWKDLASEHGGVLPITLTATVTLKNGKLTFDTTLENKSTFTVETVDYPYFGDLNPPTSHSTVAARTMWYGNLGSDEIYPDFGNEKGYWGVDFPIKTFGSHRSNFCLIQAQTEGLYVELSDPTLPYYIGVYF